MRFKTEWYCHDCWQEGVVETEAPVEDPKRSPGIIDQHRNAVRGFGGKCDGDLRFQEHNPRPRIKTTPPPPASVYRGWNKDRIAVEF